MAKKMRNNAMHTDSATMFRFESTISGAEPVMANRWVNNRIMKLIVPLWRDPVGWAEQVAKTRLRVLIWTFVHVCFVSGGILWIDTRVQQFSATSHGVWFAVLIGASPIALIRIAYPAMYLYAMHRLVKIVRSGVPYK